ncbi:putative indole-3-pyruvate monooxygenase yucca10 [Quercus suber]|uniref:indole-3-pyruvate monooxygenase n=1 Tax=Quercus suber TaxID=58331 RepID=A0AAW0KCN2_QUESU
MQEQVAIIVGAGTSGLAIAACLSQQSIPRIILEREDCIASLWKKYSYDRLHLHLAKELSELPYMSFPASYPKYVPKNMFTQYVDDYVSHFKISPMYQRNVESAEYNEVSKRWFVKARNASSVVATGETTNPYIPEVKGLNTFTSEVLHSTQFKSGKDFKNKNVLVVGAGNSGMEIALDLANHGVKTSIIIHILSREMMDFARILVKYLKPSLLESLVVMLSKLVYGDLTKYGIRRPTEGPFYMKRMYGKYPLINVGTCKKIKSGEIQVLPAEILNIRGNDIIFKNGKSHPFDTIVFCTGFKRSTNLWLKGLAKPSIPNHWKGKNGLYCIRLLQRGFYGASIEAQNIANDIKSIM